MENGNSMSNISEKNTVDHKRRVFKYVRNLCLTVLLLGFITMCAVHLMRSADNMFDNPSVTSVRG